MSLLYEFIYKHLIYIFYVSSKYRGKAPFIGVMSGRTPQLLILDNLIAKDVLVKDFKNFHDNEVASMVILSFFSIRFYFSEII